jgi:hypothetical protein
MRNILVVFLLCIGGFFVYRDFFANSETTAQINAPVPQSAPQASPPTPDSLAQTIERLGGDFPIRVAVDRMADEWERRRADVNYPQLLMQQVGEKEFAVIIRGMQRMQLYEENALVQIVRVALKHERPQAPPSQREILLQGIFQKMRINVGAGAP